MHESLFLSVFNTFWPNNITARSCGWVKRTPLFSVIFDLHKKKNRTHPDKSESLMCNYGQLIIIRSLLSSWVKSFFHCLWYVLVVDVIMCGIIQFKALLQEYGFYLILNCSTNNKKFVKSFPLAVLLLPFGKHFHRKPNGQQTLKLKVIPNDIEYT